MLTAIEIENFKAFGERQRIELRPLTLLFGPNSGGKSSIIHAIHYAREIMLGRGCDIHRTESGAGLVDLGGLRRLVHGRTLDGRMITLRFELDLTGAPLEYIPAAHLYAVEGLFTVEAETAASRVRTAAVTLRIPAVEDAEVVEYNVDLNEVPFVSIRTAPGLPHSRVEALNWMHPILYERTEVDDELEKAREDLRSLISKALGKFPASADIIRKYQENLDSDEEVFGALADIFEEAIGEPPTAQLALEIERLPQGIPDWDQALVFNLQGSDQAERAFTEFASQLILGPGRALRDALQGFRYLGPLRAIPPRRLPRPDPIGYSDWPSGLGAWHRLAADADLAEDTSAWLREEHRLNTGYRLSTRRSRVVDDALLHQLLSDQITAEAYDGPVDLDHYPGLAEIPPETTFAIEDIRRGITVDPCDIGVGLSQVIPVIVAALDKQAPLVAIEQPALHLHPTAQAAVGDLLLEGALKHPGRVIIAETHSEHAILRILRRIRESREAAAPSPTTPSPDALQINYVGMQGTPSSIVRIINVDTEGELVEPWPDDFFEQDFKERFA